MGRTEVLARAGLLGVALVLSFGLPVTPAGAQGSQTSQSRLANRDVTVANRGQRAIEQIYVAPDADKASGVDRLGDRTVAPGASFRVRLGRTRECVYRVQVVYDDPSLKESRSVDLCHTRRVAFDGSTVGSVDAAGAATDAGGAAAAATGAATAATVTAAAAPTGSGNVAPTGSGNGAGRGGTPADAGPMHDVTLVNRSPQPIQQLYLSSADALQWGDDRLGERGIAVGDRRVLTWRGDCRADLRVVFENRAAEERRGIDLCAAMRVAILPGWTTADALPVPKPPPTDIMVINRSGLVVSEVNLLAEGTDGPGKDLLGSAVLGVGAQKRLALGAGDACRYKARVLFSGKPRASDFPAFDLCESPRIEIPAP
jgi:hypothetical protein